MPGARGGNKQRVSRRQMTVLFCDLVGSTELAEQLDPEDLLDALSAYHGLVKRVAARFGGFVARVTGDGVDVYFGYPVAGEDDAVRAVHAGLSIVEELQQMTQAKRIDESLKVRVGIATGLVAVSTQDSISIAGTTPNLAARVQSAINAGQVGVAPSTRRVAGEQFIYEDAGRFELKGFDGPVHISAVTGARSLASRSAWRVRGAATPIVGREPELAALLDSWRKVAGGAGAGVMMTGEAGFGKSRITTALDQRLEHEPHTTIRLQCSPFHANTALHPFSEHLAEAAGFSRHDSAATRLEKLEAQLAIARLGDDRDLCLLAALLDIDVSHRYPPLGLPPPLQLQMTKEVLKRYFAGMAMHAASAPLAHPGGNPGAPPPGGALLLVLEDLHWIDPTSLEVVDLILADPLSARILLLMTARPEFTGSFDPARAVTALHLTRLDADAAGAIARNLAAEIALPESAIETIIAKTDGVPLYIEEMTRMILESRRERQAGADAPEEIPDTLLDLLMGRLDRLGEAKWLAQVGSVLGREFPRDLLFSVAEMAPAPFEEALQAMLSSGLVLPADRSGTRYLFKHALVEDTAYASILLKSRAALHSRAADILLRDFGSSIERSPEIVARHLSRARRQLEASRFWLAAGGQALRRGAPREAAAHLKEGVSVLSEVPASQERSESELALLSVLGPTTMVLMGPGSLQFGDVQKRAFELCHALPGAPRRFPITYGLCLFHWGRAELETAHGLVRDLLMAAEANPDADESVMAANNMSGMIAFHMGDPRAARAHLERSVSRYKAERDAALYPVYLMDFGVFGRFYLALATFVTGDSDAARGHARDAHELASRLNQPHTLGFSLLANFNVAALCGEHAVARRFAEQCIEFSSQQGFPEFVAMARIVRGWANARDGDLEAGISEMDAGIELWKATGFENWQPWFACLKAEAMARHGEAEAAIAEIDHQLDRIGRNGENQFRSILLAEMASILSAKTGESERAARLFSEAKEIAQSQGAQAWVRHVEQKRLAALANSRQGP
ncbi:MAG TPA: adenylate/guanylate cyclase domain-containing protein [Opitutaceae bacterium]|nr:adenylate/guanylate cyclase domain-containing protein [Opitutaceae bacterium]